MKMMKEICIFATMGIFGMTALGLNILAKLTGLTYREINIIVYFFLIPLSWFLILHWTVMSILYIGLWTWLVYTKRKFFKEWCDCAFDIAVIFLLKFRKIGWNYWEASVIICVIVPALIYYIIIQSPPSADFFRIDRYHIFYICLLLPGTMSRERGCQQTTLDGSNQS